MTYAEFKTYLATFLWKVNDTDLVANLDNLITMGTSELDRKLDITRREVETLVTATTAGTNLLVLLPADFKHLRAVTGVDGTFTNATIQQLLKARIAYTGPLKPLYKLVYSATDALWALEVAGSIAVGDAIGVEYRNKLPDFATADASWLTDDYLDLYTYTILKHCAPFLREDERIPVWQAYAKTALDDILTEDRHNIQYGGADGSMSMPRAASGNAYPSRSRRYGRNQ